MSGLPLAIGYGTYGLKDQDVFDAIPRLWSIGYRALEITAAEGWSTAPSSCNAAQRSRVRDLIRETGFPPPAIMALLPLCASGGERSAMLGQFRSVCRIAQDLSWLDEPSVVTATLGDHHLDWGRERDLIVERLLELAGIADDHGTILAVEPHVGGTLDTPAKATWLMERTNHPALKLNFDMSHFHVQGMRTVDCLPLCLPYAVHTHIKDGRTNPDGSVQFELPGEGTFDLDEYFRLLAAHGSRLPVVVEVSGMIWKRAPYDPWATAELLFRVLAAARDGLFGRIRLLR